MKNKRPSLLDMCQGMLEGTQAATKHGLSADEVGTKKVIKPDLDAMTVSDPAANAKDTVKTSSKQTPKQAETTVLKKPTPTIKIEEVEASQPTAPQNNVTVSPSPPKEVKFFDEAGSNKLKGKYIVQSPTKFAFDSFYRKRDKGTIKPGVSLLMARHEDTRRNLLLYSLIGANLLKRKRHNGGTKIIFGSKYLAKSPRKNKCYKIDINQYREY